MLAHHFSGADLRINLSTLETLLTQCKEKKAEEQRNTDEKLAAAERQAVQKVEEEMKAKVQHMLAQLENRLQQANLSEDAKNRILSTAHDAQQR